MGVSLADFGASFNHYLPGVIKTLNSTSMARQIPLGKVKWEGEKIIKKVHVGRNVGITNTVDGGPIPSAGRQGYVDMEAYRKFIVGAVRVSEGILKNASTTKHAAITVVKSELEGLLEGIKKWEEFQFTRDGTGIVGTLGATVSAVAGGTITVSDGHGLWDGQDYTVLDTDLVTVHGTFTVTKLNRALTAAGEVTVTVTGALPAVGQATGDHIVWGSGLKNAYGNGITGLDKLIDDATGTFQGTNITSYPRHTSPVLDHSGVDRPLIAKLYRQILAMIKQESGADASREIVALSSVWDSINHEELFENMQRITPDEDTVGLDLPTFQTSFGKVKPMAAADTQPGKMFFVDRNEVSWAMQSELDWRRSDGGGIFERDNNSLGYVANAVEICEMFIEQRNRCGKIEDLKVDVKTAY